MANNRKLTPMYEQYMGIKEEYPDALLFYRMGDFYELFFEDAQIASRELQLALTSRQKDAPDPVPMCGVPWRAAQHYIGQLVDKGYYVAICDQIEDPTSSTGIVRRAVTRVISPGTILEDDNLSSKENNFLAAIYSDRNKIFSIAWLDISTGRWSGTECKNENELWQLANKMQPAELLVPEDLQVDESALPPSACVLRLRPSSFDPGRALDRVLRAQRVRDAASVGLDNKRSLVCACGALVAYLDQTQKCNPDYLFPFRPLDLGKRLIIDEITEKNLELFRTLDGKKGKGTLRDVIDHTLTPMGGRFLEDMLKNPWRDLVRIRQIQETVFFLYRHDKFRDSLREALDKVFDLERISTRISLRRASPKDFVALRSSLGALPLIRQLLGAAKENVKTEEAAPYPSLMQSILDNWDSLEDCVDLLQNAIVDNPPALLTDGGIFKPGYNMELDRLADLIEHGESRLEEMLEKEQEKTGISKLKLGYNRVFGYYFEVSRALIDKSLPEHFIRRQSLANNERFTTEELKKLETDIVSANDRRKNLELSIFQELREHVAGLRERIVHMSDLVAQIDYWQSLAHAGRTKGWCMPELNAGYGLEITDGRHPVVEDIIGQPNFVPNSFSLDDDHRLCLLTGPNMSGKSTVLRQVALIALLAHMGSMVPAKSAKIGLVDRLFSRVGASDNLAMGLSTFMVEMIETARILRQASKQSLVILDEIGRGTSTYDGVAIAWAVMETLAEKAGGRLRTLFATHYHELTCLEGRINGVFTMNIAIQEANNSIVFMHRMLPGPSDKSYGIEVARLSGIPNPVIQRAKEILNNLEKSPAGKTGPGTTSPLTLPGISLKKNTCRELLHSVSLDDLSREQAIALLKQLKETI